MGTCGATATATASNENEIGNIEIIRRLTKCQILRKTLPDFGLGKNEAFVAYLSGKMGDMTDEEISYLVIVCFGYYNHIDRWLAIGSFDSIAQTMRLWMSKRQIIQLNKVDIEFLTHICNVDKNNFLRQDKDGDPAIYEFAKEFIQNQGKEKAKLIVTIGDGDQIDFENNRIFKYYQGEEGPADRYDYTTWCTD